MQNEEISLKEWKFTIHLQNCSMYIYSYLSPSLKKNDLCEWFWTRDGGSMCFELWFSLCMCTWIQNCLMCIFLCFCLNKQLHQDIVRHFQFFCLIFSARWFVLSNLKNILGFIHSSASLSWVHTDLVLGLKQSMWNGLDATS